MTGKKGMRSKNHLPLMGVGPVYGAVIIAMTVAGILFSRFQIIPYMCLRNIKMILLMAGILLIAAGIVLWLLAIFGAKIDAGIVNNRLVTGGVYALVRNPIYAAFLFFCTGALLVYGNLWLLVLPPVYWLFLTVLMKYTEEKWLKNLYGREYEEYCRRVNRCIPWFSKRNGRR